MKPSSHLSPYFRQLENRATSRWWGRVTKATGFLIESQGPFCSVGECCEIVDRSGASYLGEIVGFNGSSVLSMPLDRPGGIGYGDRIATWGEKPTVRVSDDLLGRVISATGDPLDSIPPYRANDRWPLHFVPPQPLEREPIREPLGCGIRAIDGFLT
ncbi:MAG: flagellum-specific ATP synthase FliI, partial [Terriglobia bacterium]